MIADERIAGVAELMNYPGVYLGMESELDKIQAGKGKNIDGHAPGLRGKNLNAYVLAGVRSDHESTELAEAQEKIRLGMHILLREGSTERNLETLVPLVNSHNAMNCSFATDDKLAGDLVSEGHIDHCVRKAIKAGLPPVTALQIATINTARYFGLPKVGAIAPGWFADLNILTDLKSCVVEKVFKRGHLVAEKGYLLGNKPMSAMIDVRNTVRIRPLGDFSFHIPAKSGRARVMELIPNQIITRQIFAEPKQENGHVVSDIERDILKIAVIERHHGTGNIGLGLTKGFGLKSGAIASSVGHDAHNINVVGTNDADMRAAVEHIVKMEGGFAVANHGEILGSVALPIAGLLSNKPLSDVKDELDAANHATKKLGCAIPEPFMALSFMALSVIPELKLTDRGLVDVNQFKFVDLFEA